MNENKQKFIRQTRKLFLIISVTSLTLFLLYWGESLYRSAYIISQVVPGFPKWFEWATYDTEFFEVQYEIQQIIHHYGKVKSGKQSIDIYRPAGVNRSGFVILVPGFARKGSRDQRVVNLAKSFAASGIGVAIPHSETMRKRVFSLNDIYKIKDTFMFLTQTYYIDPEKIGICGFSVGGSYALIATSMLKEKPIFVLSFGGYFNLGELLMEVMNDKVIYNEYERNWKPAKLSKKVVFNMLNDSFDHTAAEKIIRDKIISKENNGFEQFNEKLKRLSPYPVLSDIKTRVFIMHDINDSNIPVEQARKLRDNFPPQIQVHYNEYKIMHHVTPTSFISTDIFKLSHQIIGIIKSLS